MANAATRGAIGVVGVAFAFGLAAMAAIYIFGSVSGAHINPAVTVTMLVFRKIKALKAVGYVVSQLVGAVLASLALWVSFGSRKIIAAGVTVIRPGGTFAQGLIIEALLTFFLVTTILAFMDKDTERPFHGAVSIGLVITMDILLGAVLTGASMNPARTFGPALIARAWSAHFVYWVGPIAGALLAGAMHKIWSKE